MLLLGSPVRLAIVASAEFKLNVTHVYIHSNKNYSILIVIAMCAPHAIVSSYQQWAMSAT